MTAAEIAERLDRLQDHHFIGGWRREGRRWVVECAVTWGPYTKTGIVGFVEGCNAMGAAP